MRHRSQRNGRRKRHGATLARVGIIAFALAIVVAPAVRNRALILAADAWAALSPPKIQARSASPSNENTTADHLTPRERRLLADCLRLREEIERLTPAAAITKRLVSTNAIIGQVLWTHNEGRSSLIKLAGAEAERDALIVADNAVDVGQLDGVEVDGLVLAGRSIVGRVDDCGLRSCSVVGVSSERFRVTAEIVRKTDSALIAGARGMYQGDGEAGGSLLHIPAELPVSIGDEVFSTPGSIWSGERLHIGTITHAELPPGEPHWSIHVTPSGHLVDRARVYVLRSRLQSRTRDETAHPDQGTPLQPERAPSIEMSAAPRSDAIPAIADPTATPTANADSLPVLRASDLEGRAAQ